MNHIVKAIAPLGVASLALSACGSDSDSGSDGDAEVVLSTASFVNETEMMSQAIQDWQEQVTEQTDGRVDFETHYDGALCGPDEMNDCVTQGIADIGFHSSAYASSQFPLTELGSLGFQTPDMSASGAALRDLYLENEEVQAEYESANQQLLFYANPGPHVFATPNTVDELSDFAGMDIRATGAQLVAVDELNGTPVSTSIPEVYEGLERGALGAASLPIEQADQLGVAEVAPNFYDVGEYTGQIVTMHWTINLDTWNQLDDDVREVMNDANADLNSRFIEDFNIPSQEAACESLLEAGAEFSKIGPESEGDAWSERSRERMEDEWISNAANATDDPDLLLQRFQELLEEHDTGDHRTGADLCLDLE